DKDPDRQAYLRVVLSRQAGDWRARPAGGQASSQLRSLAAANGLLTIPRGLARAAAGERYDAIILDPTSVEAGG
ncbi:MAG: molybdopterin molybdenumtransferase MoeA, partial [Chloroflexota bacterium]|nr:molybdopterin molybdenumtransferase MoeA [Chloroflexota bacterium]